MWGALTRALELLDLTAADPRWAGHHRREILRAPGAPYDEVVSIDAERHAFTVGEYDEMVRSGAFDPDLRLELLDGAVFDVTPIGSRHAGTVGLLTAVFARELGDSAIVWVQNPIELSEFSLPQPDVAILRPRSDYYKQGYPTADDVLLVVEVSDTAVSRDRTIKRGLYAAAGIRELWIVDLDAAVVEIDTDPGPSGYISARVVRPGDRLTPGTFPDLRVPTVDLLG